MLTPSKHSTQLRFIPSNPHHILGVKTKSGTRVVSVAATTLWNLLSASVKLERNVVSFCRRVKPYLFSATYPT